MKKLTFIISFFVFLILSFLIHSCEANAASYPPYGWDKGTTSTFKSGNEGLPAWFGNSDNNYYNTYTVYNPYEAVSDIGVVTSKYIIIDMCYNLPPSYFNLSSSDSSINTSLVQYLETGPSNCHFSSVSQGTNYRFYLPVSEWKVPSGGADVYVAKIQIGAHWNLTQYHEGYIRNIIVSDEWTYESDKQVIEQNNKLNSINSAINSTNAAINQTNDKLDQTNDKLDQTNDKLNQTNDKLGDLNDNITDSNTENPSSKFEEFENMLPENGVITELITLPISLFQKVLGSINGSCTEYNLGNLLGTDLKLPCIYISNYIGTTLWNVIDILFSGFFILVIGKKMIKAFNGFTSMEEGDVLD